jgi:hypothetical protein
VKIKFERTTYRGRDVFRCVAKIRKRTDLGILKSYQKTWRAFALDPMFSDKEVKRLFTSEAKRWYLKVMTRIFGDKAEMVMQQELDETNETNESNSQHSEDQPQAGGGVSGDSSEGTTTAEGRPCPDAGS